MAGHVAARRGVFRRPGGLYLGVRSVVKGWLYERVDHHRHHSVLWLLGLCHDPAGAVLTAAMENLHDD